MLTAVSLALKDSGDVEGSAARAATCLKHAEAFAIDEEELVRKAQGVLSEVYIYVPVVYCLPSAARLEILGD